MMAALCSFSAFAVIKSCVDRLYPYCCVYVL